ncbi:unnamed protein product [Dicrocoelium dendriticum]|nr:unnamed protein product [Dicrocoelium dendriticum]CAH8667339.1 unnamed protein product [Dicrocoelium dendriticum]CAH8668588.1 unnamed protein product [Dicrocoelium dendriticum]
MYANMIEQQTGEINTVSTSCLPTFWIQYPQLWFFQAESFFEINRIHRDVLKVHYVISKLPPELLLLAQDILKTSPTYQQLRDFLIRELSLSERKRVQRLLIEEQLGDRTPTQLLRAMQALVGDSPPENSIFRQLFLQRLPTHVQQILANAHQDTDLKDLALMADKIMEIQAPTISISSPPITDDSLVKAVHSLQQQLASISITHRNRNSRSGQRRIRSASRSRGICWYHRRFRNKARKCIKPCRFSISGNEHASS